jgi:soluble lytic murein transglycosylase-like protein
LNAAKDVLKAFPDMAKQYLQTDADEEIIANLITNDTFNLKVASKYLKLLPDAWSMEKKVAAYNQGPTGVAKVNPNTFKYVTEVKKHIVKYASL